MTPAIEELPVNDDAMDEDPARIALPVLLDLLPRLPEDLGAFLPHGSMFLMKIALRLLQRIPDQSTRAAVIRGVLHDTRILSGRLILLRVAGHREDIGTSLIDAAVAVELEDELRNALITLPPGDFAVEDRIARLADLMAETEDGRAALRGLVEDNRVMLSLLLECSGETRGRELGAVAVEVTKVLQWDRLAGWLGEDMLVRRVAEVFSAVADDGMEISEEEHAVLDLAADYATGNRPQTPWERLARRHHVADTTEPVAADDEHQGGDEGIDAVSEVTESGPSRNGWASNPTICNRSLPTLRTCLSISRARRIAGWGQARLDGPSGQVLRGSVWLGVAGRRWPLAAS
jgi:hypothetical protein